MGRKQKEVPSVESFLIRRRVEESRAGMRRAIRADFEAVDGKGFPFRRGPPPRAPRPAANPPQNVPDVVAQMEANMRRGWPRGEE